MAKPEILSLPTELLQKTFDYVDWDRSTCLTPSRPDIFRISLTCRHLRQAVLPILFRNVILKLRWADGALVEPALLRLQRQCPHLSKHVRCVFIETIFGQYTDPEWKFKLFTVPKGLRDHNDQTASTSDPGNDLKRQFHKQRIDNVAKTLFESDYYADLLRRCPQELREHAKNLSQQFLGNDWLVQQKHAATGSPSNAVLTTQTPLGDDAIGAARASNVYPTDAHEKIIQRKQYMNLRLQLDALCIVILCLPYSLNSLVFEALPTDRLDSLQNSFAFHVAAITLAVFGDRLQRLTMITSTILRRRSHATGALEPETENSILSPEALGHLRNVNTLALASENRGAGLSGEVQDLTHWHTISNTVTNLELLYLRGQPQEFLKLIKGFTSLQNLTLVNIGLDTPRNVLHQARQTSGTAFLSFLIELRREVPMVTLNLESVRISATESLSASGVRWLLEEAVPTGCQVDFERETRLTEDFESFLPLWNAEDSLRGLAAEIARQDGKLVDQAMSSRWQGLGC